VMYVDLSRERLEDLYNKDKEWYTEGQPTLFFMHGSLDPDEKVMNSIPKHDWTKNKDAFIIIKNQSRRDLSKSQPLDREHKPHHAKD
jgi:hypothetical protein